MDVLVERERRVDGSLADVLTVFLTGAECPFTCAHCDLWQYTLDRPTTPGAIPIQIRDALLSRRDALGPDPVLKLYNASNYFDVHAVPPSDDDSVVQLSTPFDQVVVECHPRLLGPRCFDLAERLGGRLQVAMGLETVHPEALARLNKGMTLADFDRAAAELADRGIGLRAFVLLGAPWVPPEESLDWTERAVAHAFDHGAEHVTVIPLRVGNGEIERLRDAGVWRPPTLGEIEQAATRCLALEPSAGVASVDLWDLQVFAACDACLDARRARLDAANLSGRADAPPTVCRSCGAGEPLERRPAETGTATKS